MEKRGRPRKYAHKEDVEKLTGRVDDMEEELGKLVTGTAEVKDKLVTFLTNDWYHFINKDWWRMKWQMWTVLSIQVTILATLIAAVVLIVLGLV